MSEVKSKSMFKVKAIDGKIAKQIQKCPLDWSAGSLHIEIRHKILTTDDEVEILGWSRIVPGYSDHQRVWLVRYHHDLFWYIPPDRGSKGSTSGNFNNPTEECAWDRDTEKLRGFWEGLEQIFV